MVGDGPWSGWRAILLTRGVRGFVDGLVSVLLAGYLSRLGFTPAAVGTIVTGTLVGSAALTIGVGLAGFRLERRRVLLWASALMVGTGLGFAAFTAFWPLLIVAVVGTLNPSAGDVSVFLPVEQAVLAEMVRPAQRTTAFAWYNVSGTLAGALGALVSGLPAVIAQQRGIDAVLAERAGFLLYAGAAVLVAGTYWRLPATAEHRTLAPTRPLARSRRIVLALSALFSLDSFGGGFVVQSLLVLWLYRRFALPVEVAGTVFFVAGLGSAVSQFVSAKLAARVGLVRTMVYTHVPANVFLVLAGIVPNAPLAVTFLLLRALLSQMDVPARQAYVMAVVPPEERAAAASVTNVPRSLATAIAPILTGVMLERSPFGWPLVCGGVLKLVYDFLLLAQFRNVPPLPED